MNKLTVRQKSQIYLARPYRRLKSKRKDRWLFLMVFMLPLILFLSFYTQLTYTISIWGKQVLLSVIPESSLDIAYGKFLPFFGGIFYLKIPSTLPSLQEIITNIVLTLLLLLISFLSFRKRKGGTPLTIYFSIILLIHLVSSLYFAFATELFPYSATQYSELYIKQQVGIWLSFLVLTGFLFGILGYGSALSRTIAFLGTMTYSLLFGFVRYLTFLVIVAKGSSLYMATLFFSFGPLFDFLYLVSFYGIYINLQIQSFNQGEGRLKWHWL